MYSHTPVESTCFRLGYCHSTTATACVEAEPVLIGMKVYPGCGSFSGCDSTGMPSASLVEVGGVCHNYGVCTPEGPCSVPAQCARLAVSQNPNQRHTYCDAPSESSCLVNVVAAAAAQSLSKVTCDTYCYQSQMTCAAAWDVNTPCSKGRGIGCNEERASLICECRLP
jgi:hypothetical protein